MDIQAFGTSAEWREWKWGVISFHTSKKARVDRRAARERDRVRRARKAERKIYTF